MGNKIGQITKSKIIKDFLNSDSSTYTKNDLENVSPTAAYNHFPELIEEGTLERVNEDGNINKYILNEELAKEKYGEALDSLY